MTTVIKYGLVAIMVASHLVFCGCQAKKPPEQLRALNALQDVQFEKMNSMDDSAAQNPTVSKPEINGPLTLDDAIAYALTHNLSAAVAKAEEDVQREVTTAAMMQMLPSLIVNVERSWKSRHIPSRSVNYTTGVESLEPSISSELKTETESVELSWIFLIWQLT